MNWTAFFQIFFVIAAAVAGAGLVLSVLWRHDGRRKSARDLMRDAEASIVFLFDDTDLVDATPAARKLLRDRDGHKSDWDSFIWLFGPHFPYLKRRLSGLATAGTMTLDSPDNAAVRLEAEYWDGLVRLSFVDESNNPPLLGTDRVTLPALEEEVKSLRALAEDSPQIIWKEDEEGQVTWANRAYLTLSEQINPMPLGCFPTWPPGPVFEQPDKPDQTLRHIVRRLPAHIGIGSQPKWYEVTSVYRDNAIVHFGIDVDEVVRAETTQRNFVQTLGKTFADLSTGLAIFDHHRRLISFNPALVGLTGLNFEFLSTKPLVHTVLDRLREARMLPEPKNYRSWREEIVALETAAKDGNYCENWALPNGQTYRVTGRPHPNGALAFLFEDISAEVSLTRRFRAEIETARAVLDEVEVAIAVFSESGAMTMVNRAYDQLWGNGHEIDLTTTTAIEATRLWQANSEPSAVWSGIRDYICGFGDRVTRIETIEIDNGQTLECILSPLPRGGSMVQFRPTSGARKTATPNAPRKLQVAHA